MLKGALQTLAFKQGLSVSRTSTNDEILGLIDLLKPRYADKELIRIGGANDGGYLLPDDLEGIRYCFSPGVGDSVSFEQDLAGRGIESFLADYSVESPPVKDERLYFCRKFVGACTDETHVTLDEWVGTNIPTNTGDLLLQMDIEGAEYVTLLAASEKVLSRFRIMVIEFHHLGFLFDRHFLKFASETLKKVASQFVVAHVHPNNCCGLVKRGEVEMPRVMEFTFIRKDRALNQGIKRTFPHALDQDNVPKNPTMTLPGCWR